LASGGNQYWFTFGYSPSTETIWSAIPSAATGKVRLEVEIERDANGNLTYYLRVFNVGPVATGYKLRRTTFFQGIVTASNRGAKAKTPKWLRDVGVKRVKRSR
jgi:hypothetical protein